MSKRQMPYAWEELRAFVIARDRGVCHLCGKQGANTADHLIPISRGGTDSPHNLRAAHRRCNLVRGIHRLPRVSPKRSRFDARG
jgi:5-methylcytosine-specific restriction endonuclease McrA